MAQLSDTSLFLKASFQAYYKFDSGALTTDSKNSYTLTNNNTVGEGTGKHGGSADFGASNTNKYFSRTDALGLSGSESFSFSGWAKIQTAPSSGADQQFFHINISTGSINMWFSYRNNGGTLQLYCQRNKNGTASQEVSYDVTLALETWYQVGLVYNGSTLKIFLNGAEVASASASGTGSNPVTNLTSIGQDGGGGSVIKGMIDDFGFFKNEALTSADMLEHYQDEVAGGFYYMSV